MLNFPWIMPAMVEDVLLCWGRTFKNVLAKAIWMMIPSCIWWTLWKERNRRCFEDSAVSLEILQGGVLVTLFYWANAMLAGPFLDFQDFVSFFVCML